MEDGESLELLSPRLDVLLVDWRVNGALLGISCGLGLELDLVGDLNDILEISCELDMELVGDLKGTCMLDMGLDLEGTYKLDMELVLDLEGTCMLDMGMLGDLEGTCMLDMEVVEDLKESCILAEISYELDMELAVEWMVNDIQEEISCVEETE